MTTELNRSGLELTPRSWTNFKGFIGKYKTEFKLKVVKSFLAGDGGDKLKAPAADAVQCRITSRAFTPSVVWRACFRSSI